MFADSLLESAPHLGHRSAWTKLTSALIQSAAVAIVLAIPLFHLEHLQILPPPPSIRMTIVQPPQTMHETVMTSRASCGVAFLKESVEPNFASRPVAPGRGSTQEPDAASYVGPPCVGNCSSGVLTDILSSGRTTIAVQPRPPQRPLRISDWQLGALVRKVLPDYPIVAKQLHVQGAVVLMAVIGKDGRVQNVQTISGPPLLVQPAKRAAEQWQYRPYFLNQEPVVVQTQITVNFVLNRE